MSLTLLQPFNVDPTGNYTFNKVTVSSNVDFSTTTNVNLGNVANLHISGGSSGYVLKTDGSNNLSWTNVVSYATTANSVAVANVSGIGNIATINKDGNASNILYGNGVFASAPSGGSYGNSNVATYLASYGSNTITTTGNVSVGNIIGNGQALTGLAGANVTGTVANATYATTSGSAGSATTAGTVTTAAQPNITSTGTLTALTIGPNSSLSMSGTTGYVKANSIFGLDGTAALYPYYGSAAGAVGIRTDLTVGVSGSGNLVANVGKAIFGAPANVTITGGTSGYVLSTDGAGNLSWVAQSGGTVSSISNGTSNVSIAASNGNVTVGVGGTAGVLTVTSTGANVSGTLSASGNVTSNGIRLGYLGAPLSGSDKTTSYTLTTSDLGKIVTVGTSGSITIPNSTFSAGDTISLYNNTAASATVTCSITTAYIGGTDATKASVTLATRGVATIVFISGTLCVITGSVT